MKMLQYLVIALFVHGGLAVGVEVYESWSNVDYNFPRGVSRQKLISSGKFIPNNIAPLDVDVFKSGEPEEKIFLTTPPLREGTPATLSVLKSNGKLSPYPSWAWQSDSNCSKLISVLRIRIDGWGRLWALDDGKTNLFADVPTFVCPPKVVIFNLENDKMIGSYELPDGLYTNTTSLFANIEVDSRDPAKSFAFIANVNEFKMIVFDLQNKSFWQWESPVLKYVSPYENYSVNGDNFTLQDGVLALAYNQKNDRLYFNSFSSVTQHSVSGRFLRNGKRLIDDQDSYLTNYTGTRVSQATTHALSDDGILFFNPVTENSIRCWDISTPYTQDNQHIVAKDDERLQFLTGMKIRDGRYWGLSTRLQKYIVGTTSSNETNYRIVTQTVDKLIQGTKCDTKSANWGFQFSSRRQFTRGFFNPMWYLF